MRFATAVRQSNRLLASLLAGSLLLLCLLPYSVHSESGQEQPRHPREFTYMKRKWGIEIVHMRPAAAGYMLEFRYKVLDSEKAGALFSRQTKPVLIHNRTGARMIVPTPAKTGALRNSNLPKAGHTYWMFFANPGKLVQSGETVSVEIGEFVAKDLVVR